MKPDFLINKSIKEIYSLLVQRSITTAFTLDSITNIFEVGNEVFMKYHADEYEKLLKRPPTKAPDLFDDEPFSLDRTLTIYEQLQNKYSKITPQLIKEVFEINSRLAWKEYRKKYDSYIIQAIDSNHKDRYLSFLAAVVYYDHKDFYLALKYIDFALLNYTSSADMTHFKAMCLMQLGEYEAARTYLYQALFLAEIAPDHSPKISKGRDIYPNFPVEFHTTPEQIRSDLTKLDMIEDLFNNELLKLL